MNLNHIYHQNCIETLAAMPDEFLDMTITSPPYDDLRAYKGYSFCESEVARRLFAKTKPGGVVIWVVGDRTVNGSESLTSFMHAFSFRRSGWRVHDTMIYAKNNPIPSDCGSRYRQAFEYMFCFAKGKPKTFNPMTRSVGETKAFKSFRITKTGRNDLEHDHVPPKERKLDNIFYYNVGSASSRDKIAFGHPAIFPEQLAHDQIITWSNEGDIIYDPFMGSGTTAKVAHLLGRKWLGSEIAETYVALANQRLEPYLTSLDLKAKAA